jgi:pyruvate,water dikinase
MRERLTTDGPHGDLEPTGGYVLDLHRIDRTHLPLVGGKGAHLGELSRIEGIRVPPGFCVTTLAFRRILADAPSLEDRLDRLSRLEPDDREANRELSAEVRATLEAAPIPDDVAEAISRAIARLGEHAAYAVRSSATAEDSPTASFAGQHATFLDIVGPAAILEHVRRCWASLFTERAVTYRLRNGIDHRKVHMAVVVQRMVAPEASGILFTADPLTGNRKVASVEAVFGLGEALVSGRVNADVYRVRGDDVVARSVAAPRLAGRPAPEGATPEREAAPEPQARPVLTDAQLARLARLGRRIEAHFGSPQDIEWCLAGDDFHIVQTRPITTLFPLPEARDDENRVYVSVGHQQMMTDAMRPLGLSFWLLTSPAPMVAAGGRPFVDVTAALASPARRTGVLDTLGRSDPLIGDALRTLLDRGDFIRSLPGEESGVTPARRAPAGTPSSGAGGAAPAAPAAPAGGAGPTGPGGPGESAAIEADPAIVAELVARGEASIAALERDIRNLSGPALLDFIRADLQELRRILFDPRSLPVITAAMEAAEWLNQMLHAWLGEKNAADALTQSVPNNVTSEMGLALLDVADAIRPYPEVVAFLERIADAGVAAGQGDGGGDDVAAAFLDELPRLPGGREAREALQGWLDRYGMRCVGEIDITRPRWSERPATLIPILLGHIRAFEPGEAERRFERGRQEASKKERELLERLRELPDGERKAEEAKRRIDRVRTFTGYREYPKYHMIRRYFVYKRALLEEAGRLVRAGVLRDEGDIFWLTFQELDDVVRTNRVDRRLIRRREDEFRWHRTLTPPRVLTSEGEVLGGAYRRGDGPAGALVGLAVSAGTVEGRARVVLEMADAVLEPGDILVTAYTDPSWTPLFVTIGGLVTEVGGLMTHGAVVAREYGLPAVVGVEQATRRIHDGQRIRVNGTEGWVEVVE